MGNVDYIIGIKFIKNKNDYLLNQSRYIKDLLVKHNIINCKPVRNIILVENESLRKVKIDEIKY